MLANSYLILSPAAPGDIAAAVMNQRQTIPFAWALAVSSPSTHFVEENNQYYFTSTVGDALAMLDRGMAAWNYNSYFRDTLAPVGVFRSWLANHPSETALYLNITELIQQSASKEKDLEAMRSLVDRVEVALQKIEDKDFSTFLLELRRLTLPFITIPITGDRERDVEILRYEIRDTKSVEAEMALQLVGVDLDKSVLRQATESIMLRRNEPGALPSAEAVTDQQGVKVLTLFTEDLQDARRVLIDVLGCEVQRDGQQRLLLSCDGGNIQLVEIDRSIG